MAKKSQSQTKILLRIQKTNFFLYKPINQGNYWANELTLKSEEKTLQKNLKESLRTILK
jgi:hypothetical protein